MASPSVLTAVSDSGSLPSPPVSPAHGSGSQVEAVRSPPLGASAPTPNTQAAASAPRQKSLASDGSPAGSNQAWGPPRTVQLDRMVGKSLGISIVGGRVDMFHISQEHTISGIFIKHVLEDSPAGRNGTLKTGDRILEVNGNDLRSATHDEAVLIIRNATTPVTFVVQSLSDSACPGDIEGPAPVVQWVEDKALAKPSLSAKEPPPGPKESVPTAEDPSKDAGSSEKGQMAPIPEVQESVQEKKESVAEVKQDVSQEDKKEKEGSVHKESPAPSVPSKLVSVDNAEPKPEAPPESDGEDEDEYGYNPKFLAPPLKEPTVCLHN